MKVIWKATALKAQADWWQLWQDWRWLDQHLDQHFQQEQQTHHTAAQPTVPLPLHTKMTKQMNRNEFLKNALRVGAATALVPLTTQAKPNTEVPDQLAAKIVRAPEGKSINVLGDNMLVKLTGADTYGQFTLIEETNEPGLGIPPHVHSREDEVFHVLEGELELTVGETTTTLKAGDIGFGPRGIPHSWKVVGTQKARVILSVFPSGIERMFAEISQLPAGPPDMAKVMEICDRQGIRFL